MQSGLQSGERIKPRDHIGNPTATQCRMNSTALQGVRRAIRYGMAKTNGLDHKPPVSLYGLPIAGHG
jgi:hypothetical protein